MQEHAVFILFHVSSPLLAAGMSSLEGHQRDALRPFSPVHTLLVPLPCPQGGPPQVSSMLEVPLQAKSWAPECIRDVTHQASLSYPYCRSILIYVDIDAYCIIAVFDYGTCEFTDA